MVIEAVHSSNSAVAAAPYQPVSARQPDDRANDLMGQGPAGEVQAREKPKERIRTETRQDVNTGPRPITPELSANLSLRFKPIPELGMVQGVIIDQDLHQVVKEIPPSQEIRFIFNFRNLVAKSLGSKIDVTG